MVRINGLARGLTILASVVLLAKAGHHRDYKPILSPPPVEVRTPAFTLDDFVEENGLCVNTDSEHYFARLSQEEGERQLAELTRTASLEEFFLHVQQGEESYWLEAGRKQTANQVIHDKWAMSKFLYACFNENGLPMIVTSYHLHFRGDTFPIPRTKQELQRKIGPLALEKPSSTDLGGNQGMQDFCMEYAQKANEEGLDSPVDFAGSVVMAPSGRFWYNTDETKEPNRRYLGMDILWGKGQNGRIGDFKILIPVIGPELTPLQRFKNILYWTDFFEREDEKILERVGSDSLTPDDLFREYEKGGVSMTFTPYEN